MKNLTLAQQNAVAWLSSHTTGYVVAPPSAGKTAVALTVLKTLLDNGDITQALIVAPPRVVLSAWAQELETWPGLDTLTYCVLQGKPAQRLEQLSQRCQIRIISDNSIDWLITAAHQTCTDLGQALVIDEITRWGRAGSVRVKKLRKYNSGYGVGLRRPGHKFIWRYAYGLTATPVSESWEGLYAQFVVLDGGARLGTRVLDFQNEYFNCVGYGGYDLRLQSDGAQRISTQIADAVCSLPSVADQIPGETVTHHTVPVPSEVQTALKKFRRSYTIQWGDVKISAANAGVLSGKLAQAACGALYVGDNCEYWLELHTAKRAACIALVDSIFPDNVIIVYSWGFELAWLREAFPAATVLTGLPAKKLAGVIGRTNTSKTGRILLLHPQSGGHGIDGLQCGFSRLVWTAPPWSREQWIQTCGRVLRLGQKSPVKIDVLRAENSIDSVKWAAVVGKKSFEDLFARYLINSD